MSAGSIAQLVLYVVVLLALARPLGAYMARVYEGRACGLDRVLGWLERLIYRLCGVRPAEEQGWKTYAVAMMLFNLVGLLAAYALQRLQGVLPLNPMALAAVSPDSSFNTAVSFATNTNWQGYGGETTMSYLTQMLALTVQNFVSAAAGMATLAALIRGLARRSAQTVGNFWMDLTRTTLYILLPLSFVLALALVSQGVVQTLAPYAKAAVVQSIQYDEPVTDADGKPVLDEKGRPKTKKSPLTEQVLAVGPAASQVAIKQLGTNGGGFFNVNSSHPFENATPLSNFLELLSILLIPAALCYTFGVMVRDTRQGWAVLAAMTIMFVALLIVCAYSEQQ
ncbi:MAG TPA: potassium-transporting ATPase subunit KdpA, partial [Methylomirabilota bacterium]